MFDFRFACRISGGARPRCASIFPQARRTLSSPLWSCLPFRNTVGVICFPFFSFSSSFPLFFSFFFSLFNASGMLACVCSACRIQCLAQRLLPSQHYHVLRSKKYPVESLCRCLVVTELVHQAISTL